MKNAANNIEAQSRSLRELLKQQHYKVGYFQREYKWQREHVDNLIVDLERSFFSNWEPGQAEADVVRYNKYFMGPVVLYRDETDFSIVDGQQRLTSFTLLLIFLNHKFNEVLKSKDKFLDFIYSASYGIEAYNMNIPDRVPVLDFLFRGRPFNDSIIENESCLNLLERYRDIEELFPPRLLHPEVLPLFSTWISEKLVFIEIVTQTSDSAYTIFETMNDRGLNLTPTEMLKSFLLSKSGDDAKIKSLDVLWKLKIAALKRYEEEADQEFFKAWLRGKYAVTVRSTEKDSSNEDFEKIGTRFHAWVQENDTRLLHLIDSEDYYFFVHSDFTFFVDIYLKLLEYEYADASQEHDLKLLAYKGISQSLAFPLILASLQKTDDEDTTQQKIDVTVRFVDAFGGYRLLLGDPITHSSIRNGFYTKIRDVRKFTLAELTDRFRAEILEYRTRFLKEVSYVPFDTGYAKYLLARLLKKLRWPDIGFESFYFQRKKDSFVLYQFFKRSDVGPELNNVPQALRDVFLNSLCSYCLVPKPLVSELEGKTLLKRIAFLIEFNLMIEFDKTTKIEAHQLKQFFIDREKKLKEEIVSLWKV